MNTRRIGPVTQDLNPPHRYNLRTRIIENRPVPLINNNNIANVDLPNNNNNNLVVNNIMANDLGRLCPSKFSGNPQENARLWVQRFETYCQRNNIVDDERLDAVICLITGPAENWYILLPDGAKDTYAHLRAAFLLRFANAANNVIESETFYSKAQMPGEPVAKYIDDMFSLGNKLQIGVNEMLAAIKRGLLDPIKMHVITNNINDPQNLLQQAILAENYMMRPIATIPRVQFDTSVHQSSYNTQQIDELKCANNDLKDMVNNLTAQFKKMNLHAIDNTAHNVQRSRSTTPQRNTNANDSYTQETYNNRSSNQSRNNNDNSDTPYCTYCLSHGHNNFNCRLKQFNSTQRFNNDSARYMPRPQFNQVFNTRQNYAQPWRNVAPSNNTRPQNSWGNPGLQNNWPRYQGRSYYNRQHLN
jgi:hypothetical protein